MSDRIQVIRGDITQQNVDAIVNAANTSLLGGGGVDGAIHRAAGPQLLTECRQLNGCETGEAKITRGYNLQANWVIHTVGPVWRGTSLGRDDPRPEDELLARCYRNCLKLTQEYPISTIAFPAISTGVYRFPKLRAAKIAVAEVRGFLASNTSLTSVVFVCFADPDRLIYLQALKPPNPKNRRRS
ncbi:MAG: O-acetyl-ADP-ribose deacetylase [Cyanobacteriota bacterium]|nr:O-acetyl-ADP-ribose deacetylase [Cyanobacteriota bacterium]